MNTLVNEIFANQFILSIKEVKKRKTKTT